MPASIKLLISLSAVLLLIASIACSDDAAPGDCIDAAREAGVPDRVIEWMKNPSEDWGTIERIAIREALEKFGLGEFCADVADRLDMVESSAANQAMDAVKDAIEARATRESSPTPYPTPRPPATPLPAAPAAPAAAPAAPAPAAPAEPAAASDATRITHVTFSGVAGEPNSRFTVHFSQPIVVDSPRGSDPYDDEFPVRLYIGYPDGYEDRLYYYGQNELPMYSSALRSGRPTDELSFGPVESEFSVAYYLVATKDLQDESGSPAFDQRLIPLPGDTVFLNPGSVASASDPGLASCVAFMRFAGIPSPVVRSVEDLTSDSLTDSERQEWMRFLLDGEYIRYSGDIWDELGTWKKEPCAGLWSEDSSERNATKRNRAWESECLGDGLALEDMLTLANRPYTSLDATDRIVLQIIMGDGDCRVYYPQLFYGRWIPMDPN